MRLSPAYCLQLTAYFLWVVGGGRWAVCSYFKLTAYCLLPIANSILTVSGMQ
jgi:hypothetical protein